MTARTYHTAKHATRGVRRSALRSPHTIARLRSALLLIAADASLREKLPRNSVAWQRRMRRESSRA